MKVVITGAYGQLGHEMCDALCAYDNIEVVATDIDTLDICNAEAVDDFIAHEQPQFLVNCAAYTAVDKAETDVDMARKLNAEAIEILGKSCAKYSVKIVHVSTDYVFDGTAHQPYTEDIELCPTSVYGVTKAEGEQRLRAVCNEAVIIRTAWLYSTYGNNFVKKMIELGSMRSQLNVVADQFGTPTNAADLANAIVTIITSDRWCPGVYHFTNEGFCTWYDFASAIMLLYDLKCEVLPIPTSAYPTPAKRPTYSVLSKQKIKETYHVDCPHWLKSLMLCINQLKQK